MKTAFYLALIFDVFVYPKISDFLIIVLIIFWLFNTARLKIKPIESLILATILFLFSFIAYYFNKEVVMEKSISWSVIFLTIALTQRLIKELFKKKNA